MGKIIYKKMSLFDAPENAVIIHASNASTGWGAGIAREFKNRYPGSAEHYERIIKNYDVLGKFLIFPLGNAKKHMVATLVTSRDKGRNVDPVNRILLSTELALEDMASFEVFKHELVPEVYSNKFNSGLFRVPWEKTEAVIKNFIKDRNLDWIVCDPDLND